MRLEVLDEKHGVIKVRVDSEDDLWLLSLIIAPGDIVRSVTSRDVSLGNEKRRIPMVLAVRVEHLEFQPFTNKLRVHGVVIEGPDRFGVLGSHHTISVGVGSEVTISKSEWNYKILEEVLGMAKPMNILLVAADFDEYSIALLQMQGLKFIDNKEVSLPISDEWFEEKKKEFVEELARKVIDIARRHRVDVIIIGSPGDLKNEVKELIESTDKDLKVYVDTVANGGYAGVRELLSRDVVGAVIRDSAIEKATKILEEFDKLLIKDANTVTYGIDSIEVATQLGAVKKLVVVDEMLSTFDESRKRVAKLLKDVVEKGGSVVIVPSDTPVGERVRMLGGAIAILRYSVDLSQLSNSIQ